jgi:hypothetical protein
LIFYSVTFPIIAASILLWGIAVQRIIDGPSDPFSASNTETPPPCDIVFIAVWLGVSILAGIVSFIVLFAPLSPEISLLIIALPAIGLIGRPYRGAVSTFLLDLLKHRPSGFRLILLLVTLLLPICFLGSQQTILFDTAYYHLPLGRIFEEFGAIKGLVTLHMNFGQVSSWFVLGAPSTVGGEFGWGSSIANTFICMLAAVQAAFALNRIADGSRRLCDFIAGIGFPLIFLLAARWGMISSLSPDVPTMLLAVTIAWLLSLPGGHRSVFFAIPVAAFAITIKLSALPIGLIAGIAALYMIRGESRRFAVSAAIGLAILAPFVSLSVLSTGCLVFPVSLTCFELPWTPSAEQLAVHTETIIDAARGGGRALPTDTTIVSQFLTWLSRDKSGALIILSGGVISVLLAIRHASAEKKSHSTARMQLFTPYVLAVLGLIYISVMAPTGRFSGGYTAVLAAILIATTPNLEINFRKLITIGLVPLSFAIGTIAIHITAPGQAVRQMISEQVINGVYPDPENGLLYPKRLIPFDIHHPENRQLREWTSKKIGPIIYQRPVSTGECWAAPPPCLPQGVHPNIKYIDPDRGVRGGFYIAK